MVPREYLVPYLISNAVAVTILCLAFVWPRIVKWVWVAVFIWAAAVNTLTARSTPWEYLAYGGLTPSDLYRQFIEGWFSQHIVPVVLSIAVGQLIIAMLLTYADQARRLGVVGGTIFLIAIAPLGVGSGFPFSLTAIASLFVMEWRLSSGMRRIPSPASAFVPVVDAVDEQAIDIRAPSRLVFEIAREADLLGHPVVSAIVRVRAFVMGDRPRPRVVRGLVAETLSLGWGVLVFRAGQTLVIGAVARPWARDVTFSAVEPSQFAAFDEPDLVKIVWSLEVEPHGEARTRFRTETRVVATDRSARRKFWLYWRLASPGIRLIRWMMLRSLKRQAERRYRANPHIVERAA
jgi:hypothetical protein